MSRLDKIKEHFKKNKGKYLGGLALAGTAGLGYGATQYAKGKPGTGTLSSISGAVSNALPPIKKSTVVVPPPKTVSKPKTVPPPNKPVQSEKLSSEQNMYSRNTNSIKGKNPKALVADKPTSAELAMKDDHNPIPKNIQGLPGGVEGIKLAHQKEYEEQQSAFAREQKKITDQKNLEKQLAVRNVDQGA